MCILLVPVFLCQTNIMTFIDEILAPISSTQRAVSLLRKVEWIGLPNLSMQDKYQYVLGVYLRELDSVSRIYQKSKSDPPVGRNLPPIAGLSPFSIGVCIYLNVKLCGYYLPFMCARIVLLTSCYAR